MHQWASSIMHCTKIMFVDLHQILVAVVKWNKWIPQ